MAGANAFLPWPAMPIGNIKDQAKRAREEVKRLSTEIKQATAEGRAIAPDIIRRLEQAEQIKKSTAEALRTQKDAAKEYKTFKLMKGLMVAQAIKSASSGDIEQMLLPIMLDKMTDPKLLKKISKVGNRLGFKDLGGTVGGMIPYLGLVNTTYDAIASIKPALESQEKARVQTMERARKGYISQAERKAWMERFEWWSAEGGAANANKMLKQYHDTAEKLFEAGSKGMETPFGKFVAAKMQRAVNDRQRSLGRTLSTDEKKRILNEAYVLLTENRTFLQLAQNAGQGAMTLERSAELLESEADRSAMKSAPNAPPIKSAQQLYEQQMRARVNNWLYEHANPAPLEQVKTAAQLADEERRRDVQAIVMGGPTRARVNDHIQD